MHDTCMACARRMHGIYMHRAQPAGDLAPRAAAEEDDETDNGKLRVQPAPAPARAIAVSRGLVIDDDDATAEGAFSVRRSVVRVRVHVGSACVGLMRAGSIRPAGRRGVGLRGVAMLRGGGRRGNGRCGLCLDRLIVRGPTVLFVRDLLTVIGVSGEARDRRRVCGVRRRHSGHVHRRHQVAVVRPAQPVYKIVRSVAPGGLPPLVEASANGATVRVRLREVASPAGVEPVHEVSVVEVFLVPAQRPHRGGLWRR